MNRSQMDEIRRDPTRWRRLLRYIMWSLWGAVLVGVIYYFVVVYRAPQAEPARTHVSPQTEWRDVPIADVGAGEEYQILEQYADLYLLEYVLLYDPLCSWADLDEEDDEEEPVSHGESQEHYGQSERLPGIVSDWDHLFRKYGNKYGWDWLVLAAIAYQESKFRAEVVGMGGATGLMGIMPATGRRYGYSRAKLKHAESSIRVACMALQDFGRSFAHITDSEQRMKFTLASYNSGSAHVLDARRLAENAGLDPDRWDDSVEIFMARLSEPKYYNDPLVQHGRANGDHTVRYVTEVFSRAQSYKSKVQYATTE